MIKSDVDWVKPNNVKRTHEILSNPEKFNLKCWRNPGISLMIILNLFT